MEQLFEYFNRKLIDTPIDLVRYKFAEIEWGGHALGLVGPRGVGKSTMLLQYIKMHLDVKDTLYVSADHLYFASHTLVDLADRFYKMGGKHLLSMKFINTKDGLLRLNRYLIVTQICN